VVENRLGAGGVIAASSVAKATPDGYTLLVAASTQLAIQVTLHKKLPYDPATDFMPVALLASVPFVLTVNPSVPAHSVADLIKLAKAEPGKLTFGSSGVGGPPHLFTELLKTMTGIEMTHIPYKGTAQAITDVVAGHVPIIFSDLAPAIPLIKDGRLRALGISSAVRFAGLPGVPPLAETGVPGFDAVAWLALVAPRDGEADHGRAGRAAAVRRPRQHPAHLAAARRAAALCEVGDRALGQGGGEGGARGFGVSGRSLLRHSRQAMPYPFFGDQP
jgi:tripartite-type tricarboxylate transporter receptor subunit TctC